MDYLIKKFKETTGGQKMLLIFVGLFLLGTVGDQSAQTQDTAQLNTATVQSNASQVLAEKTIEEVKVPEETHKTVTVTQDIKREVIHKDDPNLAKGTQKTTQQGQGGKKIINYKDTYLGSKKTGRVKVSEKITVKMIPKIVYTGTYVAPPANSNCNPNYSGCVPNASDVDCGGGRGNGPAYLYTTEEVIGYDVYGLDRDGDGLACEPY